jgi:hypothetical protein
MVERTFCGNKFLEENEETTEEKGPRKRGRPPAVRREKYPGRMIYVPDDLWNAALAQDGGASVFIRRLLREFFDSHQGSDSQNG